MEKTVEYMIAHIKMLRNGGFHSMADEAVWSFEKMAKGDNSDGNRHHYKGWSDSDFQAVLDGLKK